MKEFTKHLKLMGLFTKRYIMSQMEYRTSFYNFNSRKFNLILEVVIYSCSI